MREDLEDFWPSLPRARSATAGAVVSITVQVGPQGLLVQAVEFLSGGVNTRSSFRDKGAPGEVLAPCLADAIVAMVGEVGDVIGITSKPDFSLSLPGLVLNRVRITVSRVRGAMRYVSLRFHDCLGNVAAVFAERVRPWQMGYDQTVLMAVETLEKVFFPLKNFANYIESGLSAEGGDCSGPLAAGLQDTCRKIDELELYFNMLTEFVASHGNRPESHMALAVARLSASRI